MMRRCRLAAGILLATLALAGCSEDAAPTAEPEPLQIEGPWLYLGPSDGPHTLTITRSSMVYADVGGAWTSNWTIQASDNVLHHFQVAFGSGAGEYLPVGQSMSGAYDLMGTLLTVQLANGASYPQLQGAGTCTGMADGMPLPDCRLYIKQ
jgi:hypothetical protein